MTATLEAAECCAPLSAPTLSAAEAEATAELFKALADPARVRIVNILATSSPDPVCICHLIEPLGLSQPTVSHHMKKLLDAGLVDREQRGKWAYFSLKSVAVETLATVADLKGVCC
jgi:ArsR family transcriptional regulator